MDQIYRENPSSSKIKSLVELFVSAEGFGRRYLFGRNEHSDVLAKIFNVDAFVDDFVEKGAIWKDKPVIHRASVPNNGIIVNCVMNARPIAAQKLINELKIAGSISYYDLQMQLPDLIPFPKFVIETQLDFAQNKEKWEKLENSLFDIESKEVLARILQYRCTGDFTFMKQFTFRPSDQYFEDFVGLGANEVFIDAGGYDGDTAELFCLKTPDYKKVYLFEPDTTNIENAKNRLKKYRAIEFIPLGVSDTIDTLWFNPDNGSSSSIGEFGSCKINVTTIDKHVESKVTFIKMDLEGWELKALMGAKRHIIEDHPKLAIAVYHHPSDFWRILEFVHSLRQDYNIFLRHYTESWTETIMYFIPKK